MRAIVFGFTMMVLLFTSLFHIVGNITWTKPAYASGLTSYEQVIVQSGDSLWKIADQFNEDHQLTIPQMIQLIIDENQLDSAYIYPGQQIHIPRSVQ
ncbi:LysM peptidoglycan-binding domain-containing protein [Ammoniphilus sp. CFH 90114]|uniref:cell division suppressor protein YneA n=1 Tax=Ammoniphilus sp. CFH 90114 TaxID=2493665 RepID=UPI0013E93E07|nr:LysM peptidoglycan-binding domain-containing protein [Ammoniphilus sp. CFH 90114]